MPSFLLASRSVKMLPIIALLRSSSDSKGCGRGLPSYYLEESHYVSLTYTNDTRNTGVQA